MAAELRRTREEQEAGAIRDAADSLTWLDAQGVYIELPTIAGRQAYITLDEEKNDGSYEAVIVRGPERIREVKRGFTLCGAVESLRERLK